MRHAKPVLICLFPSLLIQAPLATAKDVDRQKLNPVLNRILKVEAMTASGGYSLGTAVGVASGKFVTNCHVTAHATRIDLLYEGLRWPVISQSSDTEHDLCLLSAPALQNVEPVKLRSVREMQVGQDVVALGYTFGAGLLAQAGTISALHPLDGSEVIQTTTPFNSGASGGGLFDAEGAMIGVLTFRLPGAEGFYFSLPTDWIASRIDDDARYEKVAPLAGPVPFWARPNDRKPYFMRATTLEAEGDWQGLIRLTDDWAEAEQRSAEPWLLRGQAYSRIDRIDGAIKAFQTAVQRDPGLAVAWFNLGEAYSRRGNHNELADVLSHLRPLDAELADELEVRSGVQKQ